MSTKERNAQIFELHEQGTSYRNIGKKFNLSYERVRQIYKHEAAKRDRARWIQDQIDNKIEYQFLAALTEAAKELNLETVVTRSFNYLYRSSIIQNLDEKPLNTYTDDELLQIPRFGETTLKLTRRANDIYLKRKACVK